MTKMTERHECQPVVKMALRWCFADTHATQLAVCLRLAHLLVPRCLYRHEGCDLIVEGETEDEVRAWVAHFQALARHQLTVRVTIGGETYECDSDKALLGLLRECIPGQ